MITLYKKQHGQHIQGIMMPASIATIRPTMTPMNQGASLHSPATPPKRLLSLLSIDSHLSMDEPHSGPTPGLHTSPYPKSKFNSAQIAEPNKAKIGSQANIRTIVFSASELEL